MLNTAKRPIILAGHGIMVSGAMRAFEQFVRTGNYPVAMTLLGIGCFPADNPLNLGMMACTAKPGSTTPFRKPTSSLPSACVLTIASPATCALTQERPQDPH